MELVYLWVEEYKNIRNQGFNFSPRFEFHYDKDSKKLTKVRDESTTYKSIFPENINVTAIVGENGSGKSSIQKIFFSLVYYKYLKKSKESNIKEVNKFDEQSYNFLEEQLNSKAYSNNFAIVNIDNKKNGLKRLTISEKYNNFKYEELCYKELNFFSIHFNYMIDTWYDGNPQDSWIKTIYHRVDRYNNPLLLEPFKGDSEQIIDIDNLEYLNVQKVLKNMQLLKNFKLSQFFSPNTIKYDFSEIKLDTHRIEKYFDPNKKTVSPKVLTPKIMNKLLFYIENNNLGTNNNLVNAISIFFEKHSAKEIGFQSFRFKLNNILYMIVKMLNSNKNNFEQNIYNKLKNKFDSLIKTENFDEKKLLNFVDLNVLSELIQKDGVETNKIRKCIEFQENILDNENNFKKFTNSFAKLVKIEQVEDLIDFIPPWLDIEFYENEKSFKSLSSGEKNLYAFMNNFHYQINNIIKQGYSTINLFCDEVEYGLHPDLQKRFVNELLFILNQYTKNDFKINIFFATHSPFILSDIPKENVIFLDKFDNETAKKYPKLDIKDLEDGNCINVSSEMKDFNTFGANIHTLLSHGFFMSNGLMGEFAKEKIKEILNFLNDKEELKTIQKGQIKPIIESIGEDFLRNKLLDLYYKHKDFKIESKERKKQILDEKIKKLEEERDKLND